MKTIYKLILPILIVFSISLNPLYAEVSDPSNTTIDDNSTDKADNLDKHLINLGSYIGYDLTTQPDPGIASLLSLTATILRIPVKGQQQQPSQTAFYTSLFNTFLQSIPVNSLFSEFVPSNNTDVKIINDFSNATFKSYESIDSKSKVSVNSKIDQNTYQTDPVNQALLNLVGTPDYSFCMDAKGDKTDNCNSILTNLEIKEITTGGLPEFNQLYQYDYIKSYLSQLNSNTLIAPLMYSTKSNEAPSGSSDSSDNKQNKTLQAQDQLQQAANYIRYSTGSLSPLTLIKRKDFDSLSKRANNVGDVFDKYSQVAAKDTLETYFTKLRVFAAQKSVGISNLYYILSKRIPQKSVDSSDSSQATSQALNEFTMATWRLYNPKDGAKNQQWLNQINEASSATIQKEMVTLLTEINYQLYLSRQQQERLLLTNTMILLLNASINEGSVQVAEDLTQTQ